MPANSKETSVEGQAAPRNSDAAATVIEAKRVDLTALLSGAAGPDDIFEASKATALGIEARGKGDFKLARHLYERSLGIDSPVDFIAGCANLCDLDRMEGDLVKAHATADRGIAMAQHLAAKHGLTLEDAGKGQDDPEKGLMMKAFWFAVAKAFNFKALCYRTEFDRSGTGDNRDFNLLKKSADLNAQALRIAEAIGHGYRNKVVVEVLSDRLESQDSAQWATAIETAGRYLATPGLDPNRKHNFLSIQGRAHTNSGNVDQAVDAFRQAYDVSREADLKREAANDLVQMVGVLCLNRREVEATAFYAELDSRLADLAPFDIAAQQRFLIAIHTHHPLEERFVIKI